MENPTYPQRKRTPSFSSSLLDAIYRSIDESKSNLDKETNNTTTTTTLEQISLSLNNNNNERINNLRRHSVILDDDWIEKQSTHNNSQLMNSSSVTSTSSESSYGGGGTLFFSSSETEHTKQPHKTRTRPSKQEIRHELENNHHHQHQKNSKHEHGNSFARTKLRALKIYGELNQKVRHPISPGSRIASFLSSIFSSGNVKKAKMCYVGADEDVTFEHKSKSPCFSNSSTASSSSSFSRRSCLSKTPKNNPNSNNNGEKRSVRFYPFSVILGEDSHRLPSCHRFSNYDENDPSLLPFPASVRKVSRSSNSIEEFKKCVMAKEDLSIGIEVMKGCHNNSYKSNCRDFYDNDYDDEDDEDCDALSYSSSDLFELDHIIGAARYQEELPVFETTNVETNLAIANGLCNF